MYARDNYPCQDRDYLHHPRKFPFALFQPDKSHPPQPGNFQSISVIME